MDYRIVFAPARPIARTITRAAAAALLAGVTLSIASAQQPPSEKPAAPPAKPPAAAPAKPPAKPVPAKPAAPAGAQAPAQPAPAPGQAAQTPQVQEMPPLIYSQWVKFCVSPEQAKGKQICLTGIDGRMESGMPIVAIVAIDPGNEPDAKKVLRVTMPLGMNLQYGTRFIIDQAPPLTSPFVACFANGCLSDYELNPDMLGKLKKGTTAVAQAINASGGALSVPIPLTEFAKAFDGAPTDPKVLEERQKKLEEELKRKGEELQKKANEARQKLEQSQGQAKPQ